VGGGTVFVGTGTDQRGSLFALDSSTGKTLWRYQNSSSFYPNHYLAKPVYFDGKIIAGEAESSGSIFALDPKTGKEIWKTKLWGGATAISVSTDDRTVYAAIGLGYAAFDLDSGKKLWGYGMKTSGVVMTPVVQNGS